MRFQLFTIDSIRAFYPQIPLRNRISYPLVVIPAGVEHNVTNTSSDDALRLYTLYSPPEHPDGTVHRTKADEPEEH